MTGTDGVGSDAPDVFGSAGAEALLAWADDDPRELPWRGCGDPWATLLSEVMLQQTDAARVARRWPAMRERYPTPAVMAAASPAEVIADWQGLGFNRRAVALHRCAVAVVTDRGGEVPSGLDELEELPGIGPYTARAVAAFAFGVEVGAVDTNVGRVLARRVGRTLRPAEARALADAAVPSGRAGRWNQAVFDLGATVCTKRTPRCDACPVVDGCAWRGLGPDPADGSAAVSRPQPPLRGSDREGRARLVRVLAGPGPVRQTEVAVAMGWPDDADRARRVLEGLVADGLVVVDGGFVRLPGS